MSHRAKHGCCTLNAKWGSRSWSCFWPWKKTTTTKPFWHIYFCCLLWTKAPFTAAQGATSLSADPGSAVLGCLSSLMFWLREFWRGARSPSLVLVSLSSHAHVCVLSLFLHYQGLISSPGGGLHHPYQKTTQSFGYSVTAHILSTPFNQGEEWQIAGWDCQSGCCLMIAINFHNNNSSHK